MTRQGIAALYDALHALESRYRRGLAYPVHKRLQFPDPDMTDIYDWIIATVTLPGSGSILDAGCGTGFGTLRLAAASQCDVTGISISEREIAAATCALTAHPHRARVRFLQQDFDELPVAAFDLIVAVESVKHSAGLAQTLTGFRRALRAGGTMVIVEDIYSGPADDHRAVRLASDWHLAGLYGEADYCSYFGDAPCAVIDLTDYLTAATAVRRFGRRLLRGGLLLAGRSLPQDARAALRGGLALQELYDAGLMSYRALIA